MNRQTICGALIAGVLLSAPAMPAAMAFADADDTTSVQPSEQIDFDQDETTTPVTPSEGTEFDEDETTPVHPSDETESDPGDTGSRPQGQAGPKYGPNIDGWVVRVTVNGNYGSAKFVKPSFTDNVSTMSPSADAAIASGQTGTVKGKQSASSAFGAKEPANMSFRVEGQSNRMYTITVRDSSGYSTPADVKCAVGAMGGACTVDSNAKNKEILISLMA